MVLVTFTIQYYNHPQNIKEIIKNLYKENYEILWNNDSQSDIDIFNKNIKNMKNIPGKVVLSENLHEIRGYNKLVDMAKGEYIIFCQDDDIPPINKDWIEYSINILKLYDEIKLIGFYCGALNYWGSLDPQKIKINRINPIYVPMSFVFWLNMGPFLISKKNFYLNGKFDELYSDVGECGIGFDSAFSTKIWVNNGKCLLIPNVNIERGVGGHGTKSKQQYPIRKERQKKNKIIYYEQFNMDFKKIKRTLKDANRNLLPKLYKLY